MIDPAPTQVPENFPPGHFYSVIPNLAEVKSRETEIFHNRKEVPGIDFHDDEQIKLFAKLTHYYHELDFTAGKSKDNRFYYENPNFGYGDAIILYLMIRHFKPKRIIEIGSGFSSCVTLDTNEKFFDNKIKCSFIEPFADLLKSLLKPKDKSEIVESVVQKVPVSYFKSLKKGDILFIDSTHVSKVGSDLNYILFEIFPSLKPGVIIHFHDIFHPFEYPKELIYGGLFWNENYILKAFLQFNDSFRVLFFNNYFYKYHQDLLSEKTPLFLKNPGGSIWIEKGKK